MSYFYSNTYSMKKLIPTIKVLILITGLYSCSNKPKEVYTEYGYKGPVKTVTEYYYDSVVNRFGEWVPYDTIVRQYTIDSFDTAGNNIQEDFYVRFSEDILAARWSTQFNGNRRVSTICYGVDGIQCGKSVYTYSNDAVFTTTTYDSSGNISVKMKSTIDPVTKEEVSYDYYMYDHDTITSYSITTHKKLGDTIYTVNKYPNDNNNTYSNKVVALSRDKYGNVTKSIFLDQQMIPRTMRIKVFEYYK